jgi:CRP-like cAMP-binding protein
VSVKTIAEFLADHPFTKGLAPEHLELIAGCATNRTLKEGEYAFREGDPANTFFVIRSGRVALEIFAPQRGAITVQTVHDGEILGWSWLFAPHVSVFDARAVESTRVVAFDGACLRGKTESDHELGYQLMKRMARVFTDRLSATRMQLMDLYGKSSQ